MTSSDLTPGGVMVQFAVTFYETFAAVAVLFLSVGVLLGVGIGVSWARRRAASQVYGLGSWDTSGWLVESGTVFEPGVARVGGER